LQKQDDGHWHPIAYRSESMDPAERNYQIWDREMLAIIRALEDWRHFLEGLPQPFEIYSDHANLVWWTKVQDLSRQQARWAIWLSRFDFKLVVRPGVTMGKADALSRRSNHAVRDGEDNQSQIVLCPDHFLHQATEPLERLAATRTTKTVLKDDKNLCRRIIQSSAREAEVLKALDELRREGLRKLADRTIEWEEQDGMVRYRGRVYIPADPELRRDIVRTCHDTKLVGHPGEQGTLELVSRHYWWPGITTFVKSYVSGCEECNRIKSVRRSTRTPVHAHTVPGKPWETWSTDHIVELPPSNGHNAIMAVQDYKTKQVHFVACDTTMTAEDEADIHVDWVFRLHGLPRHVILDRGSLYTSKVMQAIYKRLGIKANFSTAFHPQTNGQTERVNQELKTFLRAFVNWRQDGWASMLPMAEFTYNSRVHSATKHSPFELLYGYKPRFNVPVAAPSTVPAVEDRLDRLREARQEANAALRMSCKVMEGRSTQGARIMPTWKKGDRVRRPCRLFAMFPVASCVLHCNGRFFAMQH
jgi:transposase InsO family protein